PHVPGSDRLGHRVPQSLAADDAGALRARHPLRRSSPRGSLISSASSAMSTVATARAYGAGCSAPCWTWARRRYLEVKRTRCETCLVGAGDAIDPRPTIDSDPKRSKNLATQQTPICSQVQMVNTSWGSRTPLSGYRPTDNN